MPRLDGALPEVAYAPAPLPLPTNRAFVVQLRAQPPGAPLSWDGRVEHVVSGQMEHFHIAQAEPPLLDFRPILLGLWSNGQFQKFPL